SRPPIFELVATRTEYFLHRYRNPELKCVSDKGSVESFRRDADNRVRQSIHHLGFADDRRIATKAVLPQFVADHDNRVRITSNFLVRLEPAAESRMHAHRIEIVRRDHTAGDAVGAIATGTKGGTDYFLCNDSVNERGVSAEVQEIRPGNVRPLYGT